MTSHLQEIVAQKQRELVLLKKQSRSFKAALVKPGLSVIGEIKRCSPSKGILAPHFSLEKKISDYVSGGVSAISVLTDSEFFSGSLQDLENVVKLTQDTKCPVLRKDFIIDELQVVESVRAGADAVLLIVAVLGEKLEQFISLVRDFNIDAVVEVHTRDELKIAVKAGAEIIAVNNRNLHDFSVDIERSLRLKQLIPAGIVTVAASGIHSVRDAVKMASAGFDAILIGDALMKSVDPIQFITDIMEACDAI